MVELNAMNGAGYGDSDSDDKYTVTGGGVTVEYRPYGLIDVDGQPYELEGGYLRTYLSFYNAEGTLETVAEGSIATARSYRMDDGTMVITYVQNAEVVYSRFSDSP